MCLFMFVSGEMLDICKVLPGNARVDYGINKQRVFKFFLFCVLDLRITIITQEYAFNVMLKT